VRFVIENRDLRRSPRVSLREFGFLYIHLFPQNCASIIPSSDRTNQKVYPITAAHHYQKPQVATPHFRITRKAIQDCGKARCSSAIPIAGTELLSFPTSQTQDGNPSRTFSHRCYLILLHTSDKFAPLGRY